MSVHLPEPTESQLKLLRDPETTIAALDEGFPHDGTEPRYDDDVYGRHHVQLAKAYRADGANATARSRAIALMVRKALKSETYTSGRELTLNHAQVTASKMSRTSEEFSRLMSTIMPFGDRKQEEAFGFLESQLQPGEGYKKSLSEKGQEVMEFEAVDEAVQRLQGKEFTAALPPYPEELDDTLSGNAAHHARGLWQAQSAMYHPSSTPEHRSALSFTKDVVKASLYSNDECWNRQRELFPSGLTPTDGPSTAAQTPRNGTASSTTPAGSDTTAGIRPTTTHPEAPIKTAFGSTTLTEAKVFARKQGLDPEIFSILDEKSANTEVTGKEIDEDDATQTEQPTSGVPMKYPDDAPSHDETDTASPTKKSSWYCC
ncbi:hypothetical protein IAT40_004114 [Kwoniella sp. CBS 6097]